VSARATQMLHAEADRCERVLDLVRYLPSHLAPGEDALGAGELCHVVERHDDSAPGESGQPATQLLRLDRQLEILFVDRRLYETLNDRGDDVGRHIREVLAGRERRVQQGLSSRVGE
jgi:hypothetical protein